MVDNALAVAWFVTGILLGLFLLGLWTPTGRPGGGAGRDVAGLAAVSCAGVRDELAYPWYALVGSSTVFVVGLAVVRLPRPSRAVGRRVALGDARRMTA